ncbi:MAG: hypothetical protein K2N34_07455 [Lachnospiraceae bacterium]|nr:hypothetical protein [Lachnospiraceae bacterium]
MSHEIQAMFAEMEDMECIKKTLISWLKEETNCGKDGIHLQSAGDTSDIIKDISETIKNCYEACYYKTVIEAMSEGRSPSYGEGSYGYNHRHLDNGEFAGSGRGHIVRGYKPGPYMDQMPYIDAHLHDPDFDVHMMGYSNDGNNTGNSGGSGNSGNRSMGYDNGSRDGAIYEQYRDARRHYHMSKDAKDKETVDRHCMSYMDNTLKNLKAMWKDADPSLKAKMKKDFGEEIAEILEDSM